MDAAKRQPDPTPNSPHARRVWPVVAIFLIVHAALAITSLRHKSLTFDEVVRLTAGYSYWVTGDYRLDPAEPPLAQMWAALPLLADDYCFPAMDQPAWWIADAESIGRQFLFGLGNDLPTMLFRARVMIVLLSIALGLVVYVWSSRLFGQAGGLLSLALYAFSPNLLAHARLVTTETATCLFFTAALAGVWWMLCHVRPASVLLSALAVAGLFLSKMSAPLIIPVGLAMLFVRIFWGGPLQVRLGNAIIVDRRVARLGVWLLVLGIQAAIAAGTMWAVHRFRYEGLVDPVAGRDRFCPPAPTTPEVSSWDYVLADSGAVGTMVRFCRQHRLLPEAYLYGVAFQFKALGAGYGFLNGERRINGWWYYFPYAFAVKTPLPLFGLLALTVVGLAVTFRRLAAAEEAPNGWPTSSPVPTATEAEMGDANSMGDSGTPRLLRLPSGQVKPWATHQRSASDLLSGASSNRLTLADANEDAPTRTRGARTSGVLIILVFLAVYWFVAIRSTVNIGHRHILPTMPLLLVLAGAAGAWVRHALMRWIVLAVAALFTAASLSIWPHYLAYFNWIGGGPRHAYQHLVDSSLDWGQDLPALKAHVDAQAADRPSYLAYFGTDTPERFDLDPAMLPSHMPWRPPQLQAWRAGHYCISATMLQLMYIMPTNAWTETFEAAYQLLRRDFADPKSGTPPPDMPREEVAAFRLLRFARLCRALREQRPDALLAYTILVYRLDATELDAILLGPPVETRKDDPYRDGPEVLTWMLRLGRAYERRGRLDEAVERYRRVLEYNPQDRTAQEAIDRVRSRSESGRPDRPARGLSAP